MVQSAHAPLWQQHPQAAPAAALSSGTSMPTQTTHSTVTASNTLHQHLAAALQRHGTSMPAPNCTHHSDSSTHSANSMRAPKRTKKLWQQQLETGFAQIRVCKDVLKDNLIFPNQSPRIIPQIIPRIILPNHTPTQTSPAGLLIMRHTHTSIYLSIYLSI